MDTTRLEYRIAALEAKVQILEVQLRALQSNDITMYDLTALDANHCSNTHEVD